MCLECKICRKDLPDQLVQYHEELKLNDYIDYTNLKPETVKEDILSLCELADQYHLKAVCINPYYIGYAAANCKHAKVCTVIGFPLGANTSKVKLYEAENAILEGAKEIDMVINIGLLKAKEYQIIIDEISDIKEICLKKDIALKVIIETALLNKIEIVIACLLAKKAGADFVKTSTGFAKSGANTEDVSLMRHIVGSKMGVKASGGIRTKEIAFEMIKAGANRIGTSSLLVDK